MDTIMQRSPIAIDDFTCSPFELLDKSWLLLSSGDFAAGQYNSMTVSWGSFGVTWGKPFAMALVRPQRHTYKFMERFDTFTLCAFPQQQHKALELLGTKSGRDIDTVRPAGLTPIAASAVAAPAYEEAELVVECRKIYFDDYEPKHFLADYIQTMYKQDYHRMYFGEILAISGAPRFSRR